VLCTFNLSLITNFTSCMVSIIIPSFNRISIIKETLDSVQQQTYPNWECIIVDDGSTDGTLEKVKQYAKQDARFRLYERDREPKGAPTCRNIGLSKAVGNYVIYLDSDDVLTPFCLEHRVKSFERYPDCDFLVFNAMLFNTSINDASFLWNIETDEDDLQRFVKLDAVWQTSGPIYQKEYLLRMQGFREDLPFWQDFDLHLRCLFSGDVYKKCLDAKPDYYIRTGLKNTISRSTPFAARREVLQLRINYYLSLSEYLKQAPFSSNQKLIHNYYSIVFYLSMQYFLRFGEYDRFKTNWQAAGNQLPSHNLSSSLTTFYALAIKFAGKFPVLKGLVKGFYSRFYSGLPDYEIMKHNHLEKIRYDERKESVKTQ